MSVHRIASLLASSTEMLYGLGLGECVVAVSHECDCPAEVRHKPRATRTLIDAAASSKQIDEQVVCLVQEGRPLYEVDSALLARLQPELIITQAQCDVCAVRYADVLDAVQSTPALRGAEVLPLNPASLGDVLGDIRRIAQACGCPQRGEAYIAALEQRVTAVQRHTLPLAPQQRPRVVCIEWIDPLMVSGNWMPQLIDWAGGTQAFAGAGEPSIKLSWEDIREFEPEVIVVCPCGFDLSRTLAEAAALTRLEGWHDTPAARQGRVYAADGNAYFNRAGPRLVETLEILAHLLHPERVPLPAALRSAFSALQAG